MRCLLLLIFLYTLSTKIAAEYNLPIPSDVNGKYFILERSGSKKMPILVTKRVGKSGTSYSKKIFDCKAGTAKYLENGETLSKMTVLKPDRFGPIVEGSLMYYKWCHACGELPIPFELLNTGYSSESQKWVGNGPYAFRTVRSQIHSSTQIPKIGRTGR